MKLLILLILSLSAAWAKPIVLISYYDAYDSAPFNNSERIAKGLQLKLNAPDSLLEIKLCALNTVFDLAYAQSESCLKNLPEAPVMFLGLGETACEVKVETMMRNMDLTFRPDNAGNNRNESKIVERAPEVLGLRYPLPQMYCALSTEEKKQVIISNFAGNFVCNNTAFQMAHFHPEIQYGFIHVPSNYCDDLNRKTENSILMLEKMLNQAVISLLSPDAVPGLPHLSNDIRLSTKKDEIKKLRKQFQRQDLCLENYLKRVKAY